MMNTRRIQTIPEQIAEQLRNDILANILQEDEPLREQELSERFGVSRGPVRAALQQLSKEGLVEAVPNVGVRVAPHPHDEVRPLISQMRRTIETFTLDKIFARLSPEVFDSLERVLDKLRIACEEGNIQALREYDRAFHGTLVDLYSEKRLYNIWHSMFTWMVFWYGRHDDLMESYREHKDILDALKDGEKAKAIRLLEGNIQ